MIDQRSLPVVIASQIYSIKLNSTRVECGQILEPIEIILLLESLLGFGQFGYEALDNAATWVTQCILRIASQVLLAYPLPGLYELDALVVIKEPPP
jgi:hypothetical protein